MIAVAEKITLKIPATVAALVRPDTAKEEKIRAARGEIPLQDGDLGMLLMLLSRDQDPDVKGTALRSVRGLSAPILARLAAAPETHPLVLDMLARLRAGDNNGPL